MEKLTKEGFWNDLMKKYPDEMKLFCNWIDEYKKRVNWNDLFNTNAKHQNKVAFVHVRSEAPKYHDLPLAMQIGIFLQYVTENRDTYSFTISSDDWGIIPSEIKLFFELETIA